MDGRLCRDREKLYICVLNVEERLCGLCVVCVCTHACVGRRLDVDGEGEGGRRCVLNVEVSQCWVCAICPIASVVTTC